MAMKGNDHDVALNSSVSTSQYSDLLPLQVLSSLALSFYFLHTIARLTFWSLLPHFSNYHLLNFSFSHYDFWMILFSDLEPQHFFPLRFFIQIVFALPFVNTGCHKTSPILSAVCIVAWDRRWAFKISSSAPQEPGTLLRGQHVAWEIHSL